MIKLTDYELYVKKHAKDRDISEEEAKEHCIVKEYKKYCKEKEQKEEGGRSES